VQQERGGEEERREHVLARRDPGHGFHVQRVQREGRGREGAGRPVSGEATQREEEEQRRRDVEQQARGVEGPRRQPEELGVELPGDPRQREPVGALEARPGPAQALRREARGHLGALGHVEVVVVLDEAGAEDGDADHPSRCDQLFRYR